MPFLSALEVVYDNALYKSTFTLLYFTQQYGKRSVRLINGIRMSSATAAYCFRTAVWLGLHWWWHNPPTHVRRTRSRCSDLGTLTINVAINHSISFTHYITLLYGTTQKKKHRSATESTKPLCTRRHKFLSVQFTHTSQKQLRWLPIAYRVNFKIANMTFRNLHSSQPAYLYSACMLNYHRHHHHIHHFNVHPQGKPVLASSLSAFVFFQLFQQKISADT